MNDSTRKQMKDIVSHASKARANSFENAAARNAATSESYGTPLSSKKSAEDRIDKNPFFEKARPRKPEPVVQKSSGSRGILFGLLFVVLLAGGFVLLNYFSTATVDILPITRNVALDQNLVALKDGGPSDLLLNFATSTEEISKEIPATIEQQIQKKASGKVMIFNRYSGSSQRLIKNTRLESPDHKIFHIDQSVVVPGLKVVNGQTVPGSVEAIVYADAAGKEYNIGLADHFTIPGFAGDPRFAKFSAASVPDSPIGGGFVGTVSVPSDTAIAQAQDELKQTLKQTIVDKARAQIPDNMALFPGSVIIKFETVPQDFNTDNPAKVTVRAAVTIFFFNTAILTQKLAEVALPSDTGKVFSISNMSTLKFDFIDPVDTIVPADLSKLQFHITGPALFVGQIDSNLIRTTLAGKSKADFATMIAGQNNINKADATIRPMWKTVFPLNPAKITVDILSK